VPLSTSTLNALQKVGAAAFTAEERLKKDVQEYAERVHAAIAKNPYSLGNDTLIENWKVAARLAHTLMGIEKELNEVYQVASQLILHWQRRHDQRAKKLPKRQCRSKSR